LLNVKESVINKMKETNPLRHSKLRASVDDAYKGVSDL